MLENSDDKNCNKLSMSQIIKNRNSDSEDDEDDYLDFLNGANSSDEEYKNDESAKISSIYKKFICLVYSQEKKSNDCILIILKLEKPMILKKINELNHRNLLKHQ